MIFNQLNPEKLAQNATDDFPRLVNRYKQYILSSEMMLKNETPAKMLNTGFISRYSKWLTLIAMIPLGLLIVYTVFKVTGISQSIGTGIDKLYEKFPEARKILGVIGAIAGVGLFAYIFFAPFIKLDLLSSAKKEKSFSALEQEKESAFFSSRMRTEAGYTALFVYPLLITISFIGLLICLISFITGLLILILVGICTFWWFKYQKSSRPGFEVSRNGTISIFYSTGKVDSFGLNDCKNIELVYKDSMDFVRWGRRGMAKAIHAATGSSSLFPYQIVFTGNNNSKRDINFENISTDSGTFINPLEGEFYFACLIKEKGFTFNCKQVTKDMILPAVEGWTAEK